MTKSSFLLAVTTLLFGVLLGFFIQRSFIKSDITPVATQPPMGASLTVPPDATKIMDCMDNQGALYIRPADVPAGPVYMVNNNKVIGIEYMLDKEQFIGGKSFKDLLGKDLTLNHVDIGFMPNGHAGYPVPHYHVDLYMVDSKTEDAIKCPDMSGMDMSGASPSASSSSEMAPGMQMSK